MNTLQARLKRYKDNANANTRAESARCNYPNAQNRSLNHANKNEP